MKAIHTSWSSINRIVTAKYLRGTPASHKACFLCCVRPAWIELSVPYSALCWCSRESHPYGVCKGRTDFAFFKKFNLIFATNGHFIPLNTQHNKASHWDLTKVTSPMTTTIRIPAYSKCSTILQTFFSDRT